MKFLKTLIFGYNPYKRRRVKKNHKLFFYWATPIGDIRWTLHLSSKERRLLIQKATARSKVYTSKWVFEDYMQKSK